MELGNKHLGLENCPAKLSNICFQLGTASVAWGVSSSLLVINYLKVSMFLVKYEKMASLGFCIRSWRLAHMVLAEYYCSKEQRKLVLTALQLALSILKVSKLFHQDWAIPPRMLASSHTLHQ